MKLLSRLIVAAIAFLVAAGAYYYVTMSSDTWQPPAVVRVEAKGPLGSLFPSWGSWFSGAEDGKSQALLLRDGDYLFGSQSPVRYRSSDGPNLVATFDKWRSQIGSAVVSVSLDEPAGMDWLRTATDPQLVDLRLVSVPDEVDATALAALKRIAAANQHVDLGFNSDAALTQVLPLFQPRTVFLEDDISVAAIRLLANQPELDTLMLPASEAGSLDVLTTLPKLRRLALGQWDVARAGALPAGLSSLKSLYIIDSDDMKDLSALSAAPEGLEELSLLGMDNLKDITGLGKLTNLRTLMLVGNQGIGDLSSLSSHSKLRWFGMPPNTNQEQFAAFINAHPDLAVLDLMSAEGVSSLTPLASLKHLHAVILAGPVENLGTIQGLTSLRFVGISKKTIDAEPDQVAAIRKALPDAVVVQIAPMCLGSGWILLLVPVMALAWVLQRARLRAPFAA